MFSWWVTWVWPCTSSICGSTLYAIQDQMLPDAPSFWCSTWAVCASPGYTRGALVAYWFSYAPHRCRTSQYGRTFLQFSVSLWNDLSDPVFDGVRLAGFKSRANSFFVGLAARSLFAFYCFSISLLSFYGLVLWSWDLRTDKEQSLSPSLALPTFFNNNNINLACSVFVFWRHWRDRFVIVTRVVNQLVTVLPEARCCTAI